MTSSQAPYGMLLLDKPQGPTSHDLVAMARRALGTRKIGHAGTLDPMATGLMILGVGSATRLLTHITGADKDYEATVRLGAATSTEDAEGEILRTSSAAVIEAVSEERILRGMRQLTGKIAQVPSSVSAIRVNGVRAHQRVRTGERVELAAREVEVSRFELTAIRPVPDASYPALELDVAVSCSSGTYVRALARDLGDTLETGAHLTRLRRTRVGPFGIAEAASFRAGEPAPPDLRERMMSPAEAAGRLFPVVSVSVLEALALRQGKRVPLAAGGPPAPADLVAVTDPGGALVGLAEMRERPDGAVIARPVLNMPAFQGNAGAAR